MGWSNCKLLKCLKIMFYIIFMRNYTANVFIYSVYVTLYAVWENERFLWKWFMAILCQRCIIDRDYKHYIKTFHPVWTLSVQYVYYNFYHISDMLSTRGSWIMCCNKPLFSLEKWVLLSYQEAKVPFTIWCDRPNNPHM